jgi:hypothetical protein
MVNLPFSVRYIESHLLVAPLSDSGEFEREDPFISSAHRTYLVNYFWSAVTFITAECRIFLRASHLGRIRLAVIGQSLGWLSTEETKKFH